MDTDYASSVAKLNDEFRKGSNGITVTSGVQMFEDLSELLCAIRYFSNFTEDNDPYKEHDFGSLVWDGSKVFWKIDYYDESLMYGEDPLSPKCRRILTVMLASEY